MNDILLFICFNNDFLFFFPAVALSRLSLEWIDEAELRPSDSEHEADLWRLTGRLDLRKLRLKNISMLAGVVLDNRNDWDWEYLDFVLLWTRDLLNNRIFSFAGADSRTSVGPIILSNSATGRSRSVGEGMNGLLISFCLSSRRLLRRSWPASALES